MPLLNEFGIQLYSVREDTERDFPGTLRRLGDMGYTGFEFAGYGDVTAPEMKRLMDGYGIKSVGSHLGVDMLKWNLGLALTYNQILGTDYIIVPGIGMESRDDAMRAAEDLSAIGEKCAKEGFKFAYHNHSHEFTRDNGEYLLDILIGNADKRYVKIELDLFWAVYAGVEPFAYMERHSDVVRLLHVKQIKDSESKLGVDMDEGIIDFAAVIRAGIANGVEHFILEQEEYPVSPMVSVEKGIRHIMSL